MTIPEQGIIDSKAFSKQIWQSPRQRTIDDPHKPRSSDYFVEILKIRPDLSTPQYFNFATSAHLPEELRKANSDTWFTRDMRSLPMSDITRFDLAVDVNIPGRPSNGRLGLLQISNYELVNVDIHDQKGNKVSPQQFMVFEMKTNRQVFALLAGASGAYTFRAYYRYSPQGYSTRGFESGIKAPVLSQLNERLDASGFKSLTTTLKGQFSRQYEVGFQNLAQAFSIGATYTFDSTTWKTNRDADPALSRSLSF